jgi:general secretion pathway protein A
MSYFKLLGLDKEPFSTSPDPDFFYLSREHDSALANIIIELRLKRGLSVILGDIGTGKTTLSRKLVQELKQRNDMIFSIILDPSFENEYSFLVSMVKNFGIEGISSAAMLDYKEALERFLFQKGVNENKTVILIIDEAQKLSASSLETLRLLLNYETNEYKLLQLVLLGQMELHSSIKNISNFYDRISFKYTLNPLGFEETREMILFRLARAGFKTGMPLFLEEAIQQIYDHTKGYPRKVTMLCHRALKDLIIHNRVVVDADMIKGLVESEVNNGWTRSLVMN